MDRGPGFVTSPGIDNYPSGLPGGKPMEAAKVRKSYVLFDQGPT